MLFADIGGTGSRLASMSDRQQLGAPANYANCEFGTFDEILEDYLAGQTTLPSCMALAVAGPVHDEAVTITNLGWEISAESLAGRFDIRDVAIVNDFAAIAWATLGLGSAVLFKVGSGAPLLAANRGVIGPGTGLGVSGLIATGDDWTALAGEGGHVTMAATSSEEARLISHVAAEFGHCSAERLLSGPGLAHIYALSGGAECSPEQVTQLARAGDRDALHAVKLFCGMLGTVAGNLALTLGARGGIYLAGGIVPAIKQLFDVAVFRAHFEAKGRFATYLAAVPSYIITRPNPAFVGLDIYLRRAQPCVK